MAPEKTKATWLNKKHGEVGFYLAQALSGLGCFNAYLRRFKKRDEEMCCYCDSPVDNAERVLFDCAKCGVARKTIGHVVGAKLTPETMVPLILQSVGILMLIESFVTLVMKTRELDGRREQKNGRNRIGAYTPGRASGRTDDDRAVCKYKPEPTAREV